MALLDIFDSNQGRLGLGLLAMAQPSRMSDAERMMGAVQMFDQYRSQKAAAEERKADREERARMRLLQEQQIQMQLDEARRRQAAQLDAAAKRDAYLASIAGPGDGVGPTMPLDPAAALRAGLSADEQKLFNPQQQRKVKSIETLAGPNGQPIPVAVYEDGSTAVLPFGAKPEPAEKPRVPNPTTDLLIPGPNGTLVPNQALIDIKKQLQPPGINVSYGSLVAGVDAQGNPVFAQPSNRGGPPVIATNIKPAPSAAQEKQSAAGQRTQQMQAAITQARDLLQKGPTASGFGAAMDTAGRFVGASREASQIASQLETLSGWMVANVPRMEGPQSNFDVENYRTMAAKVGDRTVPVPERMAALKTLETLQKKYADINAGVPDAPPAARKATKRFNPATGRIEDITE